MPTFIEVEYDPFAPVPVDHDPWEGQSDPFAYQARAPSYAENEVSPPLASRQAGYDAYSMEIEAARGQPERDQALRDALAMRGYGSTIPTVEAQQNAVWGQPVSDRRALDLGYTPPLTQEDRDSFSQYSLPGDVRSRTPEEAWFENPPLFQGNQPEPSEVTRGMSMQGPNPGPTGITGDYYGRGKLKNYIGPNSPLRGTYRYTTPF